MKLIYVHTGKFASNSPSMTFVMYNAISLSKVTDKLFLFLKDNSVESTADIMRNTYSINMPSNFYLIRIKSLLGLKTNWLFFLQVYFRIERQLKTEKFDAIITRSTKFLPWLVRIKKKTVKVFYETHDFFADLSITDKKKTNTQKRLSRYEKKYIPQLDGVFCLQQTQINLYKNAITNYDKYYLVRTGINKIYKANFKERKYLSYIGSFDSHKGIEDLLNVFSEIAVGNKLLLIGGKSKKEIQSIEKLIVSMSLSEKVIVTGWLEKEKIYKLLQETLIGIVPLQPTFFNKNLTSPLKIFDYYSCGIPVLGSDLSTTRELIQENQTGFFFEPGNQNDLKKKLIAILSDIEMLKKISDNIYEYAKTLLWDERAKLILNIISGKENE